jgi:hypothetical protein
MRLSTVFAVVALAAAAAPAAAQGVGDLPSRTEKVQLEGRRGESLRRPGYALAEYTGGASAKAFNAEALGSYSKDRMSANFSVSRPGLAEPITVTCAGGQGRLGLGWIIFKRETLNYVCEFGGAAPQGSAFSLALSEGTLLGRMMQPQRAGELQFGEITLRTETRHISGLPIGAGAPLGYVFTRDGQAIGGIQLSGLRPAFYLPPQGSPDRDAAAVLGLILFYFQDPAKAR